MTYSKSHHYNALQIQPRKLVQITLNSSAAELKKKIRFFFPALQKV